MRLTAGIILLALFGALALTGPALAVEKGAIELKTEALVESVILNDKGQEETVMVPADKVVPGDAVTYRITYKHVGKEPATDVFVTNPIPQHMFYLDGTSKGLNTTITYSVDGGVNYDFPGNLKVKNPDGTERTATAKEYTHVRWAFPEDLTPGTEGTLEYSAELE